MERAIIERRVAGILCASLALDASHVLAPATPLLGALPELDSLALITLLQALEGEFGIVFADDELKAELFTSVGTLCDFVASKVA